MSPLTVSSDIKHTLRTLAHELGEKIKPTKQRPSDPARQEDTGLSKYVFYAPRKSDGKVPADFQDALSRAARETPNLTASEIFAEALQYANGPYGASNPAMDTFRDEVMENLAAEIRTDVDEGRLQPAHANLSTSARQWPDPIGWSGFNLSSCSALGLLPGQMTVLLRLLAQAR